ncbi:rho GTPase-activating protein SYDE1 [Austrofundulus limnaeus]|uniref:Rho GTPase-activating protein SYDE1 n=1 Tax=Austrofundulus limnaeus TaxID=52670 RepID=A0A2I4CQX9_AUSLI|nr:PREDICTED: rho GTPase-activating protein SYDE1 [Austrofundulus limnaeus]
MAEHLLRRTFFRLRGKNRSRRKNDPKVSEVLVCSDDVQTSSSSRTLTASDTPSSPPSNAAKKQQPAQQGAEAPPTCLSSAPGPSDWQPSKISQDESEPIWAQRLTLDKKQQYSDRLSPHDSPTSSLQQEASQPAGGATDSPTVSSKLPGQRAYLQSLDRSSRAWVLASGKSQEGDSVFCVMEDRGSNIWYNPIPEEEDAGGPRREEEVWKKRDEKVEGAEGCSSERPQEGASPSVSHQTDYITAEITDSPHSDTSPASPKKVGGAGSVMDKLRSPGTGRKLSFKMKKLPELRRKLSLRSSSCAHRQGSKEDRDESANRNAGSSLALSNQNVISRYHLDSSTPPARPLRQSSRGRSARKEGYLSDGDSPELPPRQQSPGLSVTQETSWCDVSSFQLYTGSDPPRCSQRVTGLLTVHLLGLKDMKSTRSEDSKEVFLAIQIDGVTRARTALLTLRGSALPLNHTFNLELERASQLRVVVLTPGGPSAAGDQTPPSASQLRVVVLTPGGPSAAGDQTPPSDGPTKNRVCSLGGVFLPPLFKGSRTQQLCVKLEPRGLLYVKLTLQETWDTQQHSEDPTRSSNVFGVELHHLVEKEGSAAAVPLLIQKTVAEIERRGLKVVGLYRLCGSAAMKKELRDWFDRNSSDVCLSEDLYPDINVITGILKDYLRELPSPLITRTLYQVVREAMTLQPPPMTPDPQLSQSTVELLSCLPHPEKATLSLLLDHLSLVASFSSFNRMTHQNLAVCFGPVLLKSTQEMWRAKGKAGKVGRGVGKLFGPGEEMVSAVDFKRHIEALHYLLQLWPVPAHRIPADDHTHFPTVSSSILTQDVLGQLPQQRHPFLRLALSPNLEEVVVSRRGRVTRLESPPPINRYAGDWSVCGKKLLSEQEADYDEVAASESDEGSEDEEEEEQKEVWSSGGAGSGLFVDEFVDFDAPFHCRLSLKDFDTLIHDLDRELAKQINICL